MWRRLWLGRSGPLFYLGKMYIGQIEKGERYTVLKKCVHIGILDFILFENETSYHSRFHIREDQRNFQYSDKLEIHICELPKLKKYTHPETKLLDWMRFLNADQEEEMEEMAGKNQYIQTAYDDLKMLSADEQKRLAYEERLKAERDYVSFAYDNWERGMRQGGRDRPEEGRTRKNNSSCQEEKDKRADSGRNSGTFGGRRRLDTEDLWMYGDASGVGRREDRGKYAGGFCKDLSRNRKISWGIGIKGQNAQEYARSSP